MNNLNVGNVDVFTSPVRIPDPKSVHAISHHLTVIRGHRRDRYSPNG